MDKGKNFRISSVTTSSIVEIDGIKQEKVFYAKDLDDLIKSKATIKLHICWIQDEINKSYEASFNVHDAYIPSTKYDEFILNYINEISDWYSTLNEKFAVYLKELVTKPAKKAVKKSIKKAVKKSAKKAAKKSIKKAVKKSAKSTTKRSKKNG